MSDRLTSADLTLGVISFWVSRRIDSWISLSMDSISCSNSSSTTREEFSGRAANSSVADCSTEDELYFYLGLICTSSSSRSSITLSWLAKISSSMNGSGYASSLVSSSAMRWSFLIAIDEFFFEISSGISSN